jgi:integrase
LATLVAFDGFLRISELVNLTLGDVALPGDPRQGELRPDARTVFRLPFTKTGSNQSAELYNADVTYLLTIYITRLRGLNQSRPNESSLFGVRSDAAYRALFHSALEALELTHCGFTPHSLRHGGATNALRTGDSMETIMQRGRWVSTSSTVRYLQQASAVRLALDVPQHWHDYAQDIIVNFRVNMTYILFNITP